MKNLSGAGKPSVSSRKSSNEEQRDDLPSVIGCYPLKQMKI